MSRSAKPIDEWVLQRRQLLLIRNTNRVGHLSSNLARGKHRSCSLLDLTIQPNRVCFCFRFGDCEGNGASALFLPSLRDDCCYRQSAVASSFAVKVPTVGFDVCSSATV